MAFRLSTYYNTFHLVRFVVRLTLAQNGVRKEKKKNQISFHQVDSVQQASNGSSREAGEVSLEGKNKVNE